MRGRKATRAQRASDAIDEYSYTKDRSSLETRALASVLQQGTPLVAANAI
jgi:hypothetical protein